MLSAGSFFVGIWMAFLTIVNIAFGAYSNGRRVNWIDFLTNGDEVTSVHEVTLSLPDDIVFGFLSSLLIAAGVMGMLLERMVFGVGSPDCLETGFLLASFQLSMDLEELSLVG